MREGAFRTAVGGGGSSARRPWRTTLAVALAVQLMVALVVVGVAQEGESPPPDARAETPQAAPPADRVAAELARPGPPAAASGIPAVGDHPPAGATTAAPSPAARAATDAVPSPLADADTEPLVVPEPGAPPEAASHRTAAGGRATMLAASGPGSDSAQIFAGRHPNHAAARQRHDVPSSFHWAVIVGVNDYMGRTSSTIGSVADAHVLRDTLYREGWRGDQVLTLTDHEATHDEIVRAIEWLIRSTDHRSTVVVSFSGHMRHESGVTALWPADNRFIWAEDLGRMLGAVRADRLWVSLQGCHAAGLAAPGLEGANRLVTYASSVAGKAYEDPATGHSVMGYYLFAEGLRDGRAAGTGDDRGSVQQAYGWAAPRATARTSGQQPYGAQQPVLADGLGGRAFPIAVTGAPPTPGASRVPSTPDEVDQDPAPSRLLQIPDLVTDLVPGLGAPFEHDVRTRR